MAIDHSAATGFHHVGAGMALDQVARRALGHALAGPSPLTRRTARRPRCPRGRRAMRSRGGDGALANDPPHGRSSNGRGSEGCRTPSAPGRGCRPGHAPARPGSGRCRWPGPSPSTRSWPALTGEAQSTMHMAEVLPAQLGPGARTPRPATRRSRCRLGDERAEASAQLPRADECLNRLTHPCRFPFILPRAGPRPRGPGAIAPPAGERLVPAHGGRRLRRARLHGRGVGAAPVQGAVAASVWQGGLRIGLAVTESDPARSPYNGSSSVSSAPIGSTEPEAAARRSQAASLGCSGCSSSP